MDFLEPTKVFENLKVYKFSKESDAELAIQLINQRYLPVIKGFTISCCEYYKDSGIFYIIWCPLIEDLIDKSLLVIRNQGIDSVYTNRTTKNNIIK